MLPIFQVFKEYQWTLLLLFLTLQFSYCDSNRTIRRQGLWKHILICPKNHGNCSFTSYRASTLSTLQFPGLFGSVRMCFKGSCESDWRCSPSYHTVNVPAPGSQLPDLQAYHTSSLKLHWNSLALASPFRWMRGFNLLCIVFFQFSSLPAVSTSLGE